MLEQQPGTAVPPPAAAAAAASSRAQPFITGSQRGSLAVAAAAAASSPGPGSYTPAPPTWSCASVGGKGYGPLASSSARLDARVAYTGPGAGAYSPSDPRTKHAATAAPCSAVFRLHTTGAGGGSNSGSQSAAASPGPCSHCAAVTHTGAAIAWADASKRASAAFKVTARPDLFAASPVPQPQQQQGAARLARPQAAAACAAATPPGLLGSFASPCSGGRPAGAPLMPQQGGHGAGRRAPARPSSTQLASRLAAVVFGVPGRQRGAGAGCGSGSARAASSGQQQGSPAHALFSDAAARAAAAVPGPGSYDVAAAAAATAAHGALHQQAPASPRARLAARPAVARARGGRSGGVLLLQGRHTQQQRRPGE